MRAARRARLLGLLAGVGLAAAAGGAGGCTENCCTVDSFPIPLTRAPLGAPPLPTASAGDGGMAPDGGALVAFAGLPGAPQSFPMVIDTGSPFTILAAPPGASAQTNPGSWNLYGAAFSASMSAPLRASFRGWDVIGAPLYPAGDATFPPLGVLGADLLRGYSVEFRFGAPCPAGGPALCSSMTFWGHLNEDASLLEDAGYAVINFAAFGGGEITAEGDPDFLGLRGPLDVPPTRVVLRACAMPNAFAPDTGSPGLSVAGCTNGQRALEQASGVDLSLMIDTGVGPLVLSASAWARVVAAAAQAQPTPITLPLPPAVPSQLPPLYVATWWKPIDVLVWATIPRFVLINLEAGPDNDPGPCVELGRSRRTEIVSYQNQVVAAAAPALCGAQCDVDPNNTGEAANSAAYLEISGQIPVAVISDGDPFLQGLRLDVLPEGPQLDGLVGANALGRSRLELDYLSSPSRAVFSCDTDDREACWAAARCPQLPDQSSVRYCFGLGQQRLPASCVPDAGLPPTDGSVDAGAPTDAAAPTDAPAKTDAPARTDAGTAIP